LSGGLLNRDDPAVAALRRIRCMSRGLSGSARLSERGLF
jgi:hypothetical protein